MSNLRKIFLYIVLIYSSLHLIRDLLSDIFGFHNWFTDIGHREYPSTSWCSSFCKWTTFPLEIFYIISAIYLIKHNKFGTLGFLMVLLIIPVLLQYHDLIIK